MEKKPRQWCCKIKQTVNLNGSVQRQHYPLHHFTSCHLALNMLQMFKARNSPVQSAVDTYIIDWSIHTEGFLAVCLSVLSPCFFFMTCEKTYACTFSHFLPPCRESSRTHSKAHEQKDSSGHNSIYFLHDERYLALIVFGTYRLPGCCSIQFL